jgi:peroxiredoxin Q/BCP
MPGRALPDFELPATGNQRFRLSALKDHPFVIYFYPRDGTPGCTDESIQLRDLYQEFQKAGHHLFGISRDSLAAHEKFKKKWASRLICSPTPMKRPVACSVL